ncbi:MAG: class I SAM-dependent methyltransferase [Gammaproteobacteria bacterium]|nr:class I SAM-dependent methyltransferase [Gammaproteobacteria bacterium]
MSNICPLCSSHEVVEYHQDKKRPYLQCQRCDLVFVPKRHHLSQQLEKAEYDKHENDLNDEGYLTFLSRASAPLLDYLSNLPDNDIMGLDFGCGPAPALAKVLTKNGFYTSIYDPYYFPDESALKQEYDFVCCTEVVEHFNNPQQGFDTLIDLLKPSGVLVIMTKLVIDDERFKNWHYKNDPTHISFFSEKTFEYIADKYQLTLQKVDKDVLFLHKST